jgi:hypothetical protein
MKADEERFLRGAAKMRMIWNIRLMRTVMRISQLVSCCGTGGLNPILDGHREIYYFTCLDDIDKKNIQEQAATSLQYTLAHIHAGEK